MKSFLLASLAASPCTAFSMTLHMSASGSTAIGSASSTVVPAVPVEASNSVATCQSEALLSILGEQSTDHFFKNVWQLSPHVYRNHQKWQENNNNNEKKVDDNNHNPFNEQIRMGSPGIARALENACEVFLAPRSAEWQSTLPIVTRNKESLTLEELATKYGNDLFAAYLDGCSVVLNHCDRHCPLTAALCEDLQKSFPYAYANAYLTPPASQTVQAHADDRDVFVIQVFGQKAWKVYEEVPVKYPYPHEQVGKNMPVPPSVVDGPCLVDTVLHTGDVLYIPRGFVHEANTQQLTDKEDQAQPSFHITIALATFDWALSGMLATAVKKTLDEEPEYRMAVPVDFGMSDDINDIPLEARMAIESQVDHAMELVRKKVTAEAINTYLKQKYEWHASKSKAKRSDRIAAEKDKDALNFENVNVAKAAFVKCVDSQMDELK